MLPIGIQSFRKLRQRNGYYVDKYRRLGAPVHLVAVEFSPETRNLAGFGAAPA